MGVLSFFLGSVFGGAVGTVVGAVTAVGVGGVQVLGNVAAVRARLSPAAQREFDIALGTVTVDDAAAMWAPEHSAEMDHIQRLLGLSNAVVVTEQDFVEKLQLTPEQMAVLRARHASETPTGTWDISAEELRRDLHLTPEQLSRFHAAVVQQQEVPSATAGYWGQRGWDRGGGWNHRDGGPHGQFPMDPRWGRMPHFGF